MTIFTFQFGTMIALYQLDLRKAIIINKKYNQPYSKYPNNKYLNLTINGKCDNIWIKKGER